MSEFARAKRFWTVSSQYLSLAASASNQISNNGNAYGVLSDYEPALPELSDEEIINIYMEKTEWADHNLVLPILFNMYHGLETMLKGFLVARNVDYKKNHGLVALHEEFCNQYPDSAGCVRSFPEKYLVQEKMPELLKEYFDGASISADEFYMALRYPESKAGGEYSHRPLKFKGRNGADFFKNLQEDIKTFVSTSVALSRSIAGE